MCNGNGDTCKTYKGVNREDGDGEFYLHADQVTHSLNNSMETKQSDVDERKGPFAAAGHTVQSSPCWRASYALGHPKQRKFKFNFMKSFYFGCRGAQLALPEHGGFCTM